MTAIGFDRSETFVQNVLVNQQDFLIDGLAKRPDNSSKVWYKLYRNFKINYSQNLMEHPEFMIDRLAISLGRLAGL